MLQRRAVASPPAAALVMYGGRPGLHPRQQRRSATTPAFPQGYPHPEVRAQRASKDARESARGRASLKARLSAGTSMSDPVIAEDRPSCLSPTGRGVGRGVFAISQRCSPSRTRGACPWVRRRRDPWAGHLPPRGEGGTTSQTLRMAALGVDEENHSVSRATIHRPPDRPSPAPKPLTRPSLRRFRCRSSCRRRQIPVPPSRPPARWPPAPRCRRSRGRASPWRHAPP